MTVNAAIGPGSRRSAPVRLPHPRTGHSEAAPPNAITVSVTLSADAPNLAGILLELAELAGDAGHVTTAVTAPTGDVGGPHHPAGSAPNEVHLDAAARIATRHGREIVLSRREFELLLFLARNPGRVFSRDQLLDAVWGHGFASERTVDVHVARIRAKARTEPPLITTVYGVGYRLATEAPVTVTGAIRAESPPSAIPWRSGTAASSTSAISQRTAA